PFGARSVAQAPHPPWSRKGKVTFLESLRCVGGAVERDGWRRPAAQRVTRGFLLPHHRRRPSVSVCKSRCLFATCKVTDRRPTQSPPASCRRFLLRPGHRGGSSFRACISAKALANIASVSITSPKPACISLTVETSAGGPGWLR